MNKHNSIRPTTLLYSELLEVIGTYISLCFVGFHKIYRGRHKGQSKGGGIAVWLKNTITGYEVEETDNEENNERLWLKLMLNNSLKMALGVVYVRPEGYDNR